MVSYISAFLFVCSAILFFWLRWRMNVSKGRFALAVVSTLLTCLIAGLSAAASTLPSSIISKISEALGYGRIESNAPSAIVAVLTAVAMVVIYRFSVSTIKSWDAPPRVSEIDLAEKYLENNLAALALEQIKLLLRGQNDRLASDTATNWREKISEAPTPVETKDLLKDLLVSAVSEIRISDDGWRDEGDYWVGTMLGPKPDENRSIIALVCNSRPNKSELEGRINALRGKFPSIEATEFFAIYLSPTTDKTSNDSIQISNKDVIVLSSRDMILKGLDLRNYAQAIIDLFEKTRVGGTDATLKNSFVELKAQMPTSAWGPANMSLQLDKWVSRETNEHLALTGEYGQGKSTALLKFCYDWAKRFIESGSIGERVPLLIELRGQNPSETDPLGFISPWCARYRLAAQQVLNLIKAGDAILIFEGFDELKNAGRAYYRHQHFNALWRFAYPGTKLIFTGRPNFFLDQEEANRTLRSQENRKVGGDAYTSVWRLQKLDQDQIELACRSYEPNVRDGIVAAVKANTEFLDIVSRPSMLPVVATIWSDIQNFDNEDVPLTSASLIEKYIQAVFSRKEAELERDRVHYDAPSGSRYLVLPKAVRELLTICVAWRMSGLKAKNTIARAEIVDMVRELYDLLVSASKSEGVAPNIAEGLIEFEKRYSDETKAERVETIAAEICSAGLLVPDAAGGNTNLRFPHKQFFEFLIAKGVSIKTAKPSLLASDLLEKSSTELKVSPRLRSEPNSIFHLIEIVGPDLKRIFSPLYRFNQQFYIFQLLLVQRIYRLYFFRRKNFYDEIDYENLIKLDFQISSTEEEAESSNSSTRFLLMLIVLLITLLITVFSIMYSIFNITGDLRSGSLEYLFLTALPLVIFTLALSSIGIVYDAGQRSVGFLFLRAAWFKADCFPESREHELRLAYQSMSKGHVEYCVPVEQSFDLQQFLYPASEFGEITRKSK